LSLTAQRVLERLRQEKGYQGEYSVLRLVMRRLSPKKPPEPSLQTGRTDPRPLHWH